jgi:hypothetical protein
VRQRQFEDNQTHIWMQTEHRRADFLGFIFAQPDRKLSSAPLNILSGRDHRSRPPVSLWFASGAPAFIHSMNCFTSALSVVRDGTITKYPFRVTIDCCVSRTKDFRSKRFCTSRFQPNTIPWPLRAAYTASV